MELAHFLPIVFHLASRKLVLYRLLWDKNCRGISLVTMDLIFLMYLTRYLDMLFLFESFFVEVYKIAHLLVSLAIIVLIRYHPSVSPTYEADLDTSFPRLALILPPFVLAIFFNKVILLVEVLHSFSWYMEALVMIPQFALLYKRQKYDTWMMALTLLLGAEGFVRCTSLVMHWDVESDPYVVYAALVECGVYVGGVAAILYSQAQTAKTAGLNESVAKPAFEEVWEAGKFEFQEGQEGLLSADGGKNGGGGMHASLAGGQTRLGV